MNPDNYLQIEIGGRKRTLYYGMNSLKVFMEEMKIKDVNKIQEGLSSIDGIVALVYALCYVGDRVDKNDIDYDAFDVGIWLDEIGEDDLKKIMDKFQTANMMGKKKPQAKGQKSTKK